MGNYDDWKSRPYDDWPSSGGGYTYEEHCKKAHGGSMATGVIKRLISEKGFGFIAQTGDGREYFFHRSALVDARFEDIKEGMHVQFEPGEGSKGPRAEQVRTAA